jgi:hypothetical protein
MKRSTRRRNPYESELPSAYLPKSLERLAQRSEEGYRDAIEEAVDLALAAAIRAAEATERFAPSRTLQKLAHATEALMCMGLLAAEFHLASYETTDVDARLARIDAAVVTHDDRARAWDDVILARTRAMDDAVRERGGAAGEFNDDMQRLAHRLRAARQDRDLLGAVTELARFLEARIGDLAPVDVAGSVHRRRPAALQATLEAEWAARANRLADMEWRDELKAEAKREWKNHQKIAAAREALERLRERQRAAGGAAPTRKKKR